MCIVWNLKCKIALYSYFIVKYEYKCKKYKKY